MTINADGTGTCDRCGTDLPNTGVTNCVTISGADEKGEAVQLHLCTIKPERCANRVLTKTALKQITKPNWYGRG